MCHETGTTHKASNAGDLKDGGVKTVNGFVLAVIGDIFFASKIRGTAEQMSINLKLARDLQTAKRLLESGMARLLLVDLHCESCDPFQLGNELRQSEKYKDLPLVGFFSHVDAETKQKAKDAGYSIVVPRSVFTKWLPVILAGEVNSLNAQPLPQPQPD